MSRKSYEKNCSSSSHVKLLLNLLLLPLLLLITKSLNQVRDITPAVPFNLYIVCKHVVLVWPFTVYKSIFFTDPELKFNEGYRSELQERALIVSLQMFSLILERCVSLLQEYINSNPDKSTSLPLDAQVLLPAIKIWCDWMFCHTSVWNPPPSTQDYRVG